MANLEKLKCQYAGVCSGCGWIDMPVSMQLQKKRESLLGALQNARISFSKEISILGLPRLGGSRDRVDLTLRDIDGKMTLGFYEKDDSAGQKRLFDLENCPLMSPALAAWYEEFRRDLPPIKVGSVRLRVSPAGERGIWLDFANEDVKRLFDDREWLTRLSSKAFVEIGQKRKVLVVGSDRLRLADPMLKPWFETWDGERKLPLNVSVGGFTQPGFEVNRLLVGEVLRLAGLANVPSWIELGSGAGNFTIPFALNGYDVTAIEFDRGAVESLGKNLDAHRVLDQVNVELMSFQRIGDGLVRLIEERSDGGQLGILADPPRSGLGGFVDVLRPLEKKPEHFIYVSCFQDSLVADLRALVDNGYTIEAISGVDQFPHTPHCEWVVSLKTPG